MNEILSLLWHRSCRRCYFFLYGMWKGVAGKKAEFSTSQNSEPEKTYQKESGSHRENRKEEKIKKQRGKSPSKQNLRVKDQSAKKKRSQSVQPEIVKQTRQAAQEQEQILENDSEDDYDGYYDDVLPEDEGCFSEGLDRTLIRKVFIIAGAVFLIVSLCVLMMYVL